MAFTEAELLKIVTITSFPFSTVEGQVRYLGTSLTPALEIAVREQMDRWDTVGNDFTRIYPSATNFGTEINPETEKADIRRNIRRLLYLGGDLQTFGATRIYRS